MFIINWVFDKLGYMPKIDMEVGKVDVQFEAWPFPTKNKKPVPRTKPKVARKTTGKKPNVVAKTARSKKTKK